MIIEIFVFKQKIDIDVNMNITEIIVSYMKINKIIYLEI